MCELDICKALVNLAVDDIEEEEEVLNQLFNAAENDQNDIAGRIYI